MSDADNVIPIHSPALKLLQDDPDLLRLIANSKHPACQQLTDWVVEIMTGKRVLRPRVGYHRPARAEFDRMLTEAVSAVVPRQLAFRWAEDEAERAV